jgi:hypothetical protein
LNNGGILIQQFYNSIPPVGKYHVEALSISGCAADAFKTWGPDGSTMLTPVIMSIGDIYAHQNIAIMRCHEPTYV